MCVRQTRTCPFDRQTAVNGRTVGVIPTDKHRDAARRETAVRRAKRSLVITQESQAYGRMRQITMPDDSKKDVRFQDATPLKQLEEGDEVTLVWSPYKWAREDFGFTGAETVIISDLPPESERSSKFMVDITMKLPDGDTLTWHLDNGYVTCGKNGAPFDKGRARKIVRADG